PQIAYGTEEEQQQRQELRSYLLDCLPVIESALTAQREHGKETTIVAMPSRTEAELHAYIETLKTLPRQPASNAMADFIKMSWRPVRVRLGTGTDSSAITFTVGLPDGLSNVAVLDASYPIRLLEQLDRTVKTPGDLVFSYRGLMAIKAWSSLTLHMI